MTTKRVVTLGAPGGQVLIHLAVMLEVLADDHVDVRQVERRVLPNDLFGDALRSKANTTESSETRVSPTRNTPSGFASSGTAQPQGQAHISLPF